VTSTRPRVLAAVGLGSAAFGGLTATLLALLGSHSLSGGYVAVSAVTLMFRVTALVGGLGAGAALLFDRTWAALIMLGAAAFFLGYTGGYFFAQGLGLWYPTR
jgi:hypothetical protein